MEASAKTVEDGLSLLDRVKSLPPLPTVAMKILRQFGDQFIDGNKVADIIAQDPVITARLIGLANSAYFAPRVPVTDMRAVVTRVLGTDNVRTLALGLAAGQLFDVSRCKGFDSSEFWVRSLNTAARCRNLANAVTGLLDEDRDSAYALGLCHELGALAYAYLEPELISTLLDEYPEEIDEQLEQHFGVNRSALTCTLSVHWQMPAVFVRVYSERSGLDKSRMTLLLETAAEADRLTADADEPWLQQQADRLGLNVDALASAIDTSSQELRTVATAKILRFTP
ncbi:MAG: HDOD domain-containing protein [Gammaproteobacteria bacterium]